MNWRAWLARFKPRERRLITAAAALMGLALVRLLIVSPFLSYRESLREEIAEHREMIENGRAYLARASEVARQRDTLKARVKEVRDQLVPGNTPTLAAASLQDTLHGVAGEKGVNIQSTQVMREETIGDFRRVAIRMTATGELRQIADFMAAVEYGTQRVVLPFLEISRKGAVLRGQSGRALAATVEVSAFLQNVVDEAAPAEAAAAEDASAASGQGEPASAASPAAQAEEAAASAPGPEVTGQPGSALPSPGKAPTVALNPPAVVPSPSAASSPPAVAPILKPDLLRPAPVPSPREGTIKAPLATAPTWHQGTTTLG